MQADNTAVHSAVHVQPRRHAQLGRGVQVIICGAELFTSNAAMLPAALYEGRVTLQQLLRNWGIAYTGAHRLAGAMRMQHASMLHRPKKREKKHTHRGSSEESPCFQPHTLDLGMHCTACAVPGTGGSPHSSMMSSCMANMVPSSLSHNGHWAASHGSERRRLICLPEASSGACTAQPQMLLRQCRAST